MIFKFIQVCDNIQHFYFKPLWIRFTYLFIRIDWSQKKRFTGAFAHLLITVIFETCYVEISRSCVTKLQINVLCTQNIHT